MPIDKAKLRASREAAVIAKQAFEATFEGRLSECAVGVGISRDGKGWALKVYVQNPRAEPNLPNRFQKFDVDVEVTGSVVIH